MQTRQHTLGETRTARPLLGGRAPDAHAARQTEEAPGPDLHPRGALRGRSDEPATRYSRDKTDAIVPRLHLAFEVDQCDQRSRAIGLSFGSSNRFGDIGTDDVAGCDIIRISDVRGEATYR